MKKISILSILWVFYFLSIYIFDNIFRYMHYVSAGLLICGTLLYIKNSNGDKKLFNYKGIYLYFLVFFCYTIITFFWASAQTMTHQSIIRNILEMILVIFCGIEYISDKSKIYSFIKIFIYTTLIMAILYYLTSPISTWGSVDMGDYLGIWRNSAGYYMAFAAFFSLFVYKYDNKNRIYIILFIILSILAVGTGSRKSIIHIILSIFLLNFLEKERKVHFKNVVIIIIMCFISYLLIHYNSTINYIFNTKILSMVNDGQADASTKVRKYFIEFAFNLFLQKPIFGHGMDGFKIWLSSQSYFLQMWGITGVPYSHCNYVELLANSGIIGFLLYYFYPIKLIITNFKNRENSIVRLGICSLLVFIILDYGTISYYMKEYLLILMISLICTKFKYDIKNDS